MWEPIFAVGDQGSDAPRPSGRLAGLPSYGRGRAGQGVVFAHRLGSNEAPDPPSAAIQAAVARAMAGAHRYPDLRGEMLVEALASRHGLPSDMIAVSAGSVTMLDQLVRAFCDPGDRVITAWRSYEAYPIIVGGAGARLLEVPLDSDHRLDMAAILHACRSQARVVIICNPNNPTGTMLGPAELEALLDAIPAQTLVILDEAYADYADEAGMIASSPARRLSRHRNLVVLRTFSKAWGLAGMRVGYCLADRSIVAAANTVAPPFPLPMTAQAAALAALAEGDVVTARITASVEQRRRMSEGLAALGFQVALSKANFVWLAVGEEAGALTLHLHAAGIAVRCFHGEGVRVTTGTAADTQALLTAAAAWMSR
ncbi:histidinol-phosphate transaminase [Mesorhizobium sp. B4-1-4]|nr:histidinol-phosphate transaminase [Mesorhizobium sp. B4-1-4]